MTDQEKLHQQLGEIGGRYLKRTLGEIDTLRELAGKLRSGEAKVLKEIEHLSHKIHGSGAMFGFDGLSQQARKIEMAASEGTTTPELQGRIDLYIDELASIAETTVRERGV